MSSFILYISRAVCFAFLESSAKFSRGLPLGPMLLGSGAWQWPQFVPKSASHLCMISWTCSPVRFLGRTLRFVGAGAGGWACGAPGGCGDDGAWADEATARRAAVRRATTAAGRDREVFFVKAGSSSWV